MYGRRLPALLVQASGRQGKRKLGIWHENHVLAREFSGLHQQAACLAASRFLMELFLGIAEVAGPGILQACDGLQHNIRPPFELSAKKIGKLLRR